MLILFFFNDTSTTEIYTLSLHDALPIFDRNRLRGVLQLEQSAERGELRVLVVDQPRVLLEDRVLAASRRVLQLEIGRDTSELQSQSNLVCRLLLEKKKKNKIQSLLKIIK